MCKKYPREELIKHTGSYGGLFCETCNEKKKITWSSIGIIMLVLIIACFICWLLAKLSDWRDSKQKEENE